MILRLFGDILPIAERKKANSRNLLLINRDYWALYEFRNGRYVRITRIEYFIFIDDERHITAVIEPESIIVIRTPRGPRGLRGPQGPEGASGICTCSGNQTIYGSAYSLTAQTLSGGGIAGQYVHFTGQGAENGITLNSSNNGLTLSNTGNYEANYSLTAAQPVGGQVSVRLDNSRIGYITGSAVTTDSMEVAGTVQFSAISGDEIMLANNLPTAMTLYTPLSNPIVAHISGCEMNTTTLCLTISESFNGTGSIYVAIQWGSNSSQTITSVYDTNGNTYQQAGRTANNTNGPFSAAVYYADLANLSSGTITITVSSAPSFISAEAVFLQNVAPNSLASVGPPDSGSMTSSGNAVISGYATAVGQTIFTSIGGTNIDSISGVSPTTVIDSVSDSGFGGADAYQIASTVGSVSSTVVITSSSTTSCWAGLSVTINTLCQIDKPTNAQLSIKQL